MTDAPEVICVGELLIDLISTNYADDFNAAETYRRYPGGSPANLANNLSLLGCSAALVATVGDDDAGDLLQNWGAAAGANVDGICRVNAPTTLILVTKSRSVGNFEAYRSADYHILPEQLPNNRLASCRLFHTTAFALSREPARSSIFQAARTVAESGGSLSIDVNYAPKIWPDVEEARRVIGSYMALDPRCLVKFSDIDLDRLYGHSADDPAAAATYLMRELKTGTLCLTLGERGCYVAGTEEAFLLPARPVEVRDTTGAGDAFWAGFLAAWLSHHDLGTRARAGRNLAERKLATIGPLTQPLTLEQLLRD